MNALKDLGRRMLATLIDLATSKKALASAGAVFVGLFVKGPAQRDRIVEAIIAYVISQGIVDHAKARADAALGIATSTVTATTSTPVSPAPGPVAKIGVVLILALALGASGCGTLAPNAPPVAPVAGTPSCNAFNLIDDVGSDLVSGQWLNALEDLARLCGQDVVSLVVREVGTKSAHAALASGDGLAKLKADHARTYLLIHPVNGT